MKLTREGQVFYPAEPCEGLEEKILLMQAGGLPDSEEKQLMSHIEKCGACKTLYRHYELIDENIRDHLAAQRNIPPRSMPKKLRIMLSEASKQHFASRLQELGHSILFQKPEVCDLIRPWTPPQPLDHCVKMLNNSCASLLKDPFIEEVGLKPDFVEDCRRYLGSLVENPERLMDAESAKETFDRSLSVVPDRVLTVKSITEYYLSKYDVLSVVSEYKRLLKLRLNPDQKYKALINLCSNSTSAENYDEAEQSLESAESLSNSAQLYFVKFKLYYMKHKYNINGNNLELATENLKAMDSLIETMDVDSEDVSLIAKCFHKKRNSFFSLALNNEIISRIISKYSDMMIEN